MKPLHTFAQMKGRHIFGRSPSANDAVAAPNPRAAPSVDAQLLHKLANGSKPDQIVAAESLRKRTKDMAESRRAVLELEGGPDTLAHYLHSPDIEMMEHVIAILHNACLSDDVHLSVLSNKELINGLVHVLKKGNNSSRATAAATIFVVGRSVEMAAKLVQFPGLFCPLVDLLRNGSERGQKDALYALYCLTICEEGRIEAEKAGAVEWLLKMFEKGDESLEEKAVAVVANLARSECGRISVWKKGGLWSLSSVLEHGSVRALEDAIATIYSMCKDSPGYFQEVVAEGLMPSIIPLSSSTRLSSRAQQKAKILVDQFRSQRGSRVAPGEGSWQSFSSNHSGFSSFRSEGGD